MICPKCNKPALMLFADGNCSRCQPVLAPVIQPSAKKKREHRPCIGPTQERFCTGIAPEDYKTCPACGIPIVPGEFQRPSEYRRRRSHGGECAAKLMREARNEWWINKRAALQEMNCEAKREGVYTRP